MDGASELCEEDAGFFLAGEGADAEYNCEDDDQDGHLAEDFCAHVAVDCLPDCGVAGELLHE